MSPRDRFILFLADGFAVGRIPVAPGTFGSLLGTVFAGLLYSQTGLWITLGAAAAAFFLSVWAGTEGERILRQTDPGRIVIDEIAAMPLACLPFAFHPAWPVLFASFVVFRLFDISKPFPINISQRLPGGWGLTIDDTLAAICTAAAVGAGCHFYYR